MAAEREERKQDACERRRGVDHLGEVEGEVRHEQAEAERLEDVAGEEDPKRAREMGGVRAGEADHIGKEPGHPAILGGAGTLPAPSLGPFETEVSG